MHLSTKDFVRFLDHKKLRYTVREADGDNSRDIVRINFTADSTDMTIQFFFNEDNEDAAIRVFDLAKVPSAKIEKIYHTLSEQNNRFRFAKFCLDERDNTIQMEMDAAFRSHDVGEICHELLLRTVDICDKAYPEFMKAIYAE